MGLEEGVFPLSRAMLEESELEEERRLAYVGITRAEEALFLTNAYSRTLYGRTQYNQPSRFLEEIEAERLMRQGAAANLQKAPARTFDPKVFKPSASKPAYTQPATKSVSNKVASGGEKVSWQAGDKVQHKAWGVGTVVRVGGSAKDLELDIAFPEKGIKRLLAAFAPIEKI